MRIVISCFRFTNEDAKVVRVQTYKVKTIFLFKEAYSTCPPPSHIVMTKEENTINIRIDFVFILDNVDGPHKEVSILPWPSVNEI